MSPIGRVRTADGRCRLLVPLCWIVVGFLCLPIDLPLSRALIDGLMPGELRDLFMRGEAFGHAYGALAIIITIYLLDVPRRSKLWHVAASFLAGGLSADLIKLQVWRIRPRPYVEADLHGPTFVGSIWTGGESLVHVVSDHSLHSFPSAHTAGSVAMAYSLGRIYPAGRQWFYVLAGLCVLNRVDGGAHYASDVCWGVALGYLAASLLPPAEQLAARISRWQGRVPSRGAPTKLPSQAA